MLVVAGARVAAPGVDLDQVGMQVDRRARDDVKGGPGDDEQQQQDRDRAAAALEIEPGVDRALDRRDHAAACGRESHAANWIMRGSASHPPAARKVSRGSSALAGGADALSSVSATR